MCQTDRRNGQTYGQTSDSKCGMRPFTALRGQKNNRRYKCIFKAVLMHIRKAPPEYNKLLCRNNSPFRLACSARQMEKVVFSISSIPLGRSHAVSHFSRVNSRYRLISSCYCVFSVDEPGDSTATATVVVQIDDEESTVRFVDNHHGEVLIARTHSPLETDLVSAY